MSNETRMMKNRGIWIWGIFAMFILTSMNVFAAPVPDTGQSTCYDAAGNLISCPNSGQDFYGQDANYSINPPSYTKLDVNGNALAASSTSWVMVKDNVTGLIWEVKTDDGSIHDKDNTYTWYDPDPATNGGNAGTPGEGTDTDDFINALNSTGFGGYADWRMPDRKELHSIIDYGRYNPAINTDYFPNTVWHGYWSSTTYSYDASKAVLAYFSSGGVGRHFKAYYVHYYVRAVRGGQ